MIDKQECAIVRIVAGRLVEARQLCKLTKKAAAERLGIEPRELGDIENTTNVATIPLKLVRQASLIYDVSLDYLFGYSDDWEVCEEVKDARNVGEWIHSQNQKMFNEWAIKQVKLEQQIETMKEIVARLPAEVEEIAEAMESFRKLNPSFDNMPGGSQLSHRIHKAQLAKCQMRRCKLIKNE